MEATSYAEQALSADAPRAAGERSALADLYDRHAEAVYRLLLALLASQSDAQDALSDLFLELARRDLRHIQSPRAYLLAAARNKALQMLRRRKREQPTDPAHLCFFEAAALDPEQALLAQRVGEALRALPPEQRAVVVLKIYEGLTFVEIAKITRTRPNTAASRYRYALEKLRARLQEE